MGLNIVDMALTDTSLAVAMFQTALWTRPITGAESSLATVAVASENLRASDCAA